MDINPAPVASKKAARKRSPVERALVWGGILILLLIVGLEWSSRDCFDRSLNSLEKAIRTVDETGNPKPLSTEDARKYLRGLAFRGEDTSDPQRKITYRWPSLFKVYKLGLSVDQSNRVNLVEAYVSPDALGSSDNSTWNSSEQKSRTSPTHGLPKGSDQVVGLTTVDLPVTSRMLDVGSLARELIRQAFLISAQQELGLTALDASLDELKLVDAPQSFPFEITASFEPNPQSGESIIVKVEVSRPDRAGKWFDWSSKPIVVPIKKALESLAEKLEELSRGEFVEALKQAGFVKSNATVDAAPSAPKELEGRMDFVAQFGLLRSFHSQVRANPQSAASLESLIRSYANLGNMTDFHWNASSKVFKARALLYAQRLIAKFGVTPVSLAHRAYARALVGRHTQALEDINAARAAQGQEIPEWLNLVDAFCSYKPDVLEETEGPLEELALYLRMRMVDPIRGKDEAIECIQLFSKLNPACFRSAEYLCEIRALGISRMMTEGGFDQIWPEVYTRLAEVPDLPRDADEIAEKYRIPSPETIPADEHRARMELIQSLQTAAAEGTDKNEISWIVLAEMLKDVTFVQAWRKLDVEAFLWGIESDQSIHKLSVLVKGHRFEKFINAYSSDKKLVAQALEDLGKLKDTTLFEMPVWEIGLFVHRKGLGSAQQSPVKAGRTPGVFANRQPDLVNWDLYRQFAEAAHAHSDRIYDDLLRYQTSSGDLSSIAQYFTEICPYQPQSIAVTIESKWDASKSKAAEWEKTYGKNSSVLMALAKKYESLDQSTDAVRCWQKLIEIAPSHQAYVAIAKEYQKHDDDDAAIKTLEEALKLPSYGLENAWIQEKIADILMKKGNFKAAMPHATAAATSYSGFGLKIAARCAEGLGQWRVAESYERALSERYEEGSSHDWYFWCVRTGRGDRAQASALASKRWKLKDQTPVNERWDLGAFQIINGETKKALDTFSGNHDFYLDIQSSIIADQLGETSARDQIFDNIGATSDPTYPLPKLIDLFRVAVRNKDDFHWSHKSFEALLAITPSHEVTFAYYCAGTLLESHGEHELAREYLQCAARSSDVGRTGCLLANHFLREKKIPVGKTRIHMLPDELATCVKLLWKAKRAGDDGQIKQAQQYLTEALELRPEFAVGQMNRALLLEKRGEYQAAISDYEEAFRINPEYVALNVLYSSLLSTCDQDDIRNGPKSLEHAELAFKWRGIQTWAIYDALASAHAECGHFDKAVEFQEKARRLNQQNSQLQEKLILYQEGKPFHRAPKAATEKT